MRSYYKPKTKPYQQKGEERGMIITARVPKGIHRRLLALARRKGRSLAWITEASVRRTLLDGDIDTMLVPFRLKGSNGKPKSAGAE